MKNRKIKRMEYQPILLELVKLTQPDLYVEVGTQRGYTFNAVSQLCKKAIGIDIVMQGSVLKRGNVELKQMDSTEFVKDFKGEIDILFIDADHKKESVLKDFYNLAPFVKEGTGIICFHDTYPVNEALMVEGYCFNAWEAIDELRKKEKDYEFFTIPGPWAGFTLCRKRGGKHLHWFTPKQKHEGVGKKKTDLFKNAREAEIKKGDDIKELIPKNAKTFELDYSLPDAVSDVEIKNEPVKGILNLERTTETRASVKDYKEDE